MQENQDKPSTDEVHRLETKFNKNPGGGEIFHTRPDQSSGSPSLLCNGYWVIPGGKAAGVWSLPLIFV